MKCPVCNAWVEVQETRQRKEGRYRRYQCGNLHTFGTMESLFVIYDEEFKRQNKEARIARLQAQIKRRRQI
jgi:transcriptional regulator NrdR family protein